MKTYETFRAQVRALHDDPFYWSSLTREEAIERFRLDPPMKLKGWSLRILLWVINAIFLVVTVATIGCFGIFWAGWLTGAAEALNPYWQLWLGREVCLSNFVSLEHEAQYPARWQVALEYEYAENYRQGNWGGPPRGYRQPQF